MLHPPVVTAMTKPLGTLALAAALTLAPALSRAQEDQPYWTQDGWEGAADEPPPTEAPPAPPPAEVPPAPPQAQAQPAPVPPGQWVYTQQYGWIWMPYADAYTQVPPSGSGTPYAYVYYPAYGWTWLAAPWVWGIGPWPVFGVWGPVRFAWYSHGWWRYPARWHYHAPAYGGWGHRGYGPGYHGYGYAPGYRGHGPGWGGRVGITRPAPHRASVGAFRGGAPAQAFTGRGGGGGGRERGAWSGGVPARGGGSHIVAPRGGGRSGGGRSGGDARGSDGRGHGRGR